MKWEYYIPPTHKDTDIHRVSATHTHTTFAIHTYPDIQYTESLLHTHTTFATHTDTYIHIVSVTHTILHIQTYIHTYSLSYTHSFLRAQQCYYGDEQQQQPLHNLLTTHTLLWVAALCRLGGGSILQTPWKSCLRQQVYVTKATEAPVCHTCRGLPYHTSHLPATTWPTYTHTCSKRKDFFCDFNTSSPLVTTT